MLRRGIFGVAVLLGLALSGVGAAEPLVILRGGTLHDGTSVSGTKTCNEFCGGDMAVSLTGKPGIQAGIAGRSGSARTMNSLQVFVPTTLDLAPGDSKTTAPSPAPQGLRAAVDEQPATSTMQGCRCCSFLSAPPRLVVGSLSFPWDGPDASRQCSPYLVAARSVR